MPLDTTSLTTAIRSAMDKAENTSKQTGATPEQVKQAFAEDLANAMKAFVSSGQVNFPIPVQVTPASGTGATTAAGTIS